jgi:hypothetical protein
VQLWRVVGPVADCRTGAPFRSAYAIARIEFKRPGRSGEAKFVCKFKYIRVRVLIRKDLGQTVLVETKTGATGGSSPPTSSPPASLTVIRCCWCQAVTLKTLPFDAVKSFEWISNIITSPFCGVSKIAVPVPRRDR